MVQKCLAGTLVTKPDMKYKTLFVLNTVDLDDDDDNRKCFKKASLLTKNSHLTHTGER